MSTPELFVDLRPISPQERLNSMRAHAGPWIADLTTGVLPEFFQFPNFKGAFARGAHSPVNRYECTSPEARAYLESQGAQGLLVPAPKLAFTFPRVISMLLNESFFARHEKLATPQDLDRAMRFGVNYPLGLCAWGELSSLHALALLLDHLYNATGDRRYQRAPGF